MSEPTTIPTSKAALSVFMRIHNAQGKKTGDIEVWFKGLLNAHIVKETMHWLKINEYIHHEKPAYGPGKVWFPNVGLKEFTAIVERDLE